jgi:hypothetical protein
MLRMLHPHASDALSLGITTDLAQIFFEWPQIDHGCPVVMLKQCSRVRRHQASADPSKASNQRAQCNQNADQESEVAAVVDDSVVRHEEPEQETTGQDGNDCRQRKQRYPQNDGVPRL